MQATKDDRVRSCMGESSRVTKTGRKAMRRDDRQLTSGQKMKYKKETKPSIRLLQIDKQ